MNDDELARRWSSGASLSDLAQAMATTRGVVAGRIHRLRRSDDRFGPRPPKPKPAAKIRKVKPIVEARPPAPLRPSVPFAALRHGQCRFVVNDAARSVGFLFCAEPVATRGGNYCRQHAERTRAPGP
jgi:hypothetical protein